MIRHIFIENFKAIHNGTYVPFQPFTVFIGNNGSGKSSIMEALRSLQTAIVYDLDEAFKEWGGLERVRNYNASNDRDRNNLRIEPLLISLSALVDGKDYHYSVRINLIRGYYTVENETLECNGNLVFTSIKSEYEEEPLVSYYENGIRHDFPYRHDGRSLILSFKGSPSYFFQELTAFSRFVENWQFLHLNPHVMGLPVIEDKLYSMKRLDLYGRNIADYLLWLKEQGETYLESLISKMQFVLPYMAKIEARVVKETINKTIELALFEDRNQHQPIPGWLLSSGTLRVLALLAMFDTPKKPSVLFVDEIENGLDPRTIGLLLSQIEDVFRDKSMQVVVTTHSPYFLDMVPLESVIVSEKTEMGSIYDIPKNHDELNIWKDKFSPGKLYTMGKLTR